MLSFLRAMVVSDEFLFYHSSCSGPGIVGIGNIIETAYPDPKALEPKNYYFGDQAGPEKNLWSGINMTRVKSFLKILGQSYLKQQTVPAELPLVRKGSWLLVTVATPG